MNSTPSELLAACQPGASDRNTEEEISGVLVWLDRLEWHIRNNGCFATTKRILRRLTRNVDVSKQSTKATRSTELVRYPPLGLQSGETVEVRSVEEIQQTLDARNKNRGMAFMPEMHAFCGKRLKVFKPVKKIIVDEFLPTARLRSVKDVVLLEGATCSGSGIHCDRSCYFFWREAWLKRLHDEKANERV